MSDFNRLGFRRTLLFFAHPGRRGKPGWYAEWRRFGWVLCMENRGWLRLHEVMLYREDE